MRKAWRGKERCRKEYETDGSDTSFCAEFLEIVKRRYGKDFDFSICYIEPAKQESDRDVVTFQRYADDAEEVPLSDFEMGDKKLVDEWREGAAKIPDSTRQQIVTMKKSGKSGREIAGDLDLPSEHVSIILIEEFAKERGETPDFSCRVSREISDLYGRVYTSKVSGR